MEDPASRARPAPAGPGPGAAGSPPTMKVSSPRSTTGTLPETGASSRVADRVRDQRGELADRVRVDRAGLQHDRAGAQARGEPVRAAVDGVDGGVVGERDQHDVARRPRPRGRSPRPSRRSSAGDVRGPAAGAVEQRRRDARRRAAAPAIAAPIRPVPITATTATWRAQLTSAASRRRRPGSAPLTARFSSRNATAPTMSRHAWPAGRSASGPGSPRAPPAGLPLQYGLSPTMPGWMALTRIGASSTASAVHHARRRRR